MKILSFFFVVSNALCAVSGAQSAESNVTAVDTRTLTMTQLTVTGPASFPQGSQEPYTAMLSYQGAPAQDVTAECQWAITGGPQGINYWEGPSMSGNILNPRVASPIPLLVTASIERDTGRIVSAPLAVTITESNDMNMGIQLLYPSWNGPEYLRPAGSQFTWRLLAKADGLAASQPGLNFQWFLDGAPLATGGTIDVEITRSAGSGRLRLLATAPPNRTGQQFKTLTFDAPPVANEPPALIDAVDPFFGDVLMENTAPAGGTVAFQFDPLKTPNGLVVITHGTYAKGTDAWLWQMARAIRLRLVAEGKPLPNIAIFDWGALSNPTEYWGTESVRDAAIDTTLMRVLQPAMVASSAAMDLMADLMLVRPHGQSEGQELADWIRTEWNNDHIELSAPVHLIGHSAGGFVVGECGWKLRDLASDIRVTMLDTPVPLFNHVWRYPGTGRKLERYVSSMFGTVQYPTTLLAALDDRYTVLLNSSPLAGPTVPFPTAHSYSHQWYHGTVTNSSLTDGFYWSPLLDDPPPSPMAAGDAITINSPPPPPPTDTTVPITGFTTFGAVTLDASGFILTEGPSQNAGVTRAAYSFPPGTHSLRFALRFTTPGDGDFLSVSSATSRRSLPARICRLRATRS